MIDTWHNNRISYKLNKEYPKNFSICDIDGAVRFEYYKNNIKYKRLIIYESKNQFEKKMGKSQLETLKLIKNSINWDLFDLYSGVFVLKIIDIDNTIEWYSLEGLLIRITNFENLYSIFSNKDYEEI